MALWHCCGWFRSALACVLILPPPRFRPFCPPPPPPPAATSSNLVSPTLLHFQKSAGMFSSLGKPYERRIILNTEERCLVIYADSKEKGKPAATLKLEAPGVRIGGYRDGDVRVAVELCLFGPTSSTA